MSGNSDALLDALLDPLNRALESQQAGFPQEDAIRAAWVLAVTEMLTIQPPMMNGRHLHVLFTDQRGEERSLNLVGDLGNHLPAEVLPKKRTLAHRYARRVEVPRKNRKPKGGSR